MADLQNAGVQWAPPPLWPHPAAALPGATGATGPQPGAAPVPQTPGQTNAAAATGNPFLAQHPEFNTNPNPQNPNQVQISPDILNSMGQYQNAAYANQQRTLDPQWQQNQAAFDQKMVSQGIQPGSEAYNNAYQNFSQGKNDAYSQAYNNSFQTGLAAQNQAFGQGYDNSQLANALMMSNNNLAGTLGAAGIGANASMYNNDQNNATNQLLGLGNLGISQQGMNNQANGQDFSQLMQLLGLGDSETQMNNGTIGGAQNTLLGLIPNSSPNPVDVTGAYGINQSGVNSQYNAQTQQANGTNQMVGTGLTVLAMFL